MLILLATAAFAEQPWLGPVTIRLCDESMDHAPFVRAKKEWNKACNGKVFTAIEYYDCTEKNSVDLNTVEVFLKPDHVPFPEELLAVTMPIPYGNTWLGAVMVITPEEYNYQVILHELGHVAGITTHIPGTIMNESKEGSTLTMPDVECGLQ